MQKSSSGVRSASWTSTRATRPWGREAERKLTLGGNVDNGGVRLALVALADTAQGKSRQSIDGFTPEQRLFLSGAGLVSEHDEEQGPP